MIKIILLTVFFLFIEFIGINISLNNLYKVELWKLNLDESQRRALYITNQIYNVKQTSIFVFGGSAVREFFINDKNMTKSLGISFYNCAVNSESPYDSYKLQHILKKGSIIIYGVHPKSLSSYNISQITKGYYFGGEYYKYPIFPSNNLLKKYIKNDNINFLHKISPQLNTYLYILKLYIKNVGSSFLHKDIVFIKDSIPSQYRYLTKPLSKQVLYKKINEFLKKYENEMYEDLKLNMKLIEDMIILAKKNNHKFILFELPLSPIIKKKFSKYIKKYNLEISKLLKKYPTVIFISNQNFPLSKQELFYDTIHLLPQGREYYYKSTVKLLKEVIFNDE